MPAIALLLGLVSSEGPVCETITSRNTEGVFCGPAGRMGGVGALSEADQVATMKGISVIGCVHRSASSAADSVVDAGLQGYQ